MGEIFVPKRVLIFRNKVQDHSKELVHMDEFKRKIPEFQREFAYVPCMMPQNVNQPTLFAA